MPDFSIGVDLGGTNLRIAAVSREGQLLEKVALEANAARGPDPVINEMCSAIQRINSQYERNGKFLGAGIGIPGIIDLETGTVRKSANLPRFSGYPVRAEIERRLSAKVFLDNDANFAALGEKWLGAGRSVANMAILTLGTGIGGGIVLNEKIFHGMNGMSGEFGHVPIANDGPRCGCGSYGCAEQYASATAIMRMAREAIAAGSAGLAQAANSGAKFNAEAIYKLAMKGDKDAQEIFRKFGNALGFVLAGVVNILNLEMFVIGGGVSSAWDAFAPSMFEELRSRSLVYAATDPGDLPPERAHGKTIIAKALLGSDAGLYGAARVPTVEG
jgi:glucokinase